jgi:hypothetical protein
MTQQMTRGILRNGHPEMLPNDPIERCRFEIAVPFQGQSLDKDEAAPFDHLNLQRLETFGQCRKGQGRLGDLAQVA